MYGGKARHTRTHTYTTHCVGNVWKLSVPIRCVANNKGGVTSTLFSLFFNSMSASLSHSHSDTSRALPQTPTITRWTTPTPTSPSRRLSSKQHIRRGVDEALFPLVLQCARWPNKNPKNRKIFATLLQRGTDSEPVSYPHPSHPQPARCLLLLRHNTINPFHIPIGKYNTSTA